MDYSRFRLEDFLADEYFIKWIKYPTNDSNAFWSSFLSKHPNQKAVIEEAREVILQLTMKEDEPSEERMLEIWGNIVNEKESDTVKMYPVRTNDKPLSQSMGWLRYAAAIAAVLVIAVLYNVLYANRQVRLQTSYGESRTVILPDSTKVTLNANSNLTYEKGLFEDEVREVWLSGEAFFSVVHKRDNAHFLVHTDQLAVEVLGTQFNVNARHGKTKVVLEQGKVQLHSTDGKSTVTMIPGDYIEATNKFDAIIKKQVAPKKYVSWRENRFEFSSTPLNDIFQMLEDNYGYHVKVDDPAVRSKNFTGSFSSDDVPELLNTLEKAFGLTVSVSADTINVKTQP